MLILIISLCLILLILVIISLFGGPKPVSQIPEPTNRLTETEIQYKEAPPQHFSQPTSQKTGILVVTASVEDLRVMIDPTEEEVPASVIPIPVNVPPFKLNNIPIGQHVLTAFRRGYEEVYREFTIEENSITRIHLEMIPLEIIDSY